MVAYVSKNFSLGLIVVLGLFVVSSCARLSMMVTNDEIDAICTKKGLNSRLCSEVLKPIPEILMLDTSGLAKLLINYESQKVWESYGRAISLRGSDESKEHSFTYWKCAYSYVDAANSLGSSLIALAAKDYDGVKVGVRASITKTKTCDDDLLTIKKWVGRDLIPGSYVIKELSDIILVILERLEKKN